MNIFTGLKLRAQYSPLSILWQRVRLFGAGNYSEIKKIIVSVCYDTKKAPLSNDWAGLVAARLQKLYLSNRESDSNYIPQELPLTQHRPEKARFNRKVVITIIAIVGDLMGQTQRFKAIINVAFGPFWKVSPQVCSLGTFGFRPLTQRQKAFFMQT